MTEEFHIILLPEAIDGIERAYQWIESASPQRAHKWAKGLMEAIYSLKIFPGRCPLAPENAVFNEEIRQHLYGKRGGVYRILFTIQKDAVHILYVRHSARQWVTPETNTEPGSD